MLNEIRGVVRLRGYRGQPVADESSFRDALMRVAALIAACPEIQELDVNPLNVLTSGVAALDVRIRVGQPAGRSTARRVRY
jgi:acetyltransferase